MACPLCAFHSVLSPINPQPSTLLPSLLRGSPVPAGLTQADWQRLVAEATRHGLAPFLYHRLAHPRSTGIPASEVVEASLPAVVGQCVPPVNSQPPTLNPQLPPGKPPSSVLDVLRESFLKNATRNALLYHDLAQVLTTLQTAGIKVAVLKGTHLAALIYPHIGLRPMADIDLLVPADKLELTHTLLLSLGYTTKSGAGASPAFPSGTDVSSASPSSGAGAPPASPNSGAGVPPAKVEQCVPPVPPPSALCPLPSDSPCRCGESPPPPRPGIRHPASGLPLPAAKHLPEYFKPPHPRIEIHWTIAHPALPLTLDFAAIFSRLRPATIAGIPTRVLSPEDLVLYQCTHLAGHRFSCHGLRPLCDLAATLHHHRHDLDWSVLPNRAREWHAETAVYLALRLSADLFAAPLPAGFLDSLRPADFDDQYLTLARESVLLVGSERTSAETEDNFSRIGAVADGVTGSTLVSKLRFLLSTVFPTQEHMARYMAHYYSLPLAGHRRYTCYLTRFFDLTLHGFRFLRYSLTHRQETALRARQLKRQAQLWRWLTSDSSK